MRTISEEGLEATNKRQKHHFHKPHQFPPACKMRFSIFPTFAFLAAAVSAQEATVVVNNINTLTTKANALIAPAQQLTIVNAPQILIGTGPWPVCCTTCPQTLGGSADTGFSKWSSVLGILFRLPQPSLVRRGVHVQRTQGTLPTKLPAPSENWRTSWSSCSIS